MLDDLNKFVVVLNKELNEKFNLTTKTEPMVKVAKIFLDNLLTDALENITQKRYAHMNRAEAKIATDYINKLKTYLITL